MTQFHPLDVGYYLADWPELELARDLAERIDAGDCDLAASLGPTATEALRHVLGIVALGHAIRIDPQPTTMPVGQAASILGLTSDELAARIDQRGSAALYDRVPKSISLATVIAIRDELRAEPSLSPTAIAAMTAEHPPRRSAVEGREGPWRWRVHSDTELVIAYTGLKTATAVTLQLVVAGHSHPTIELASMTTGTAVTVVTPAFARADAQLVAHLREQHRAGRRTYAAELAVDTVLTAAWTDSDGLEQHARGEARLRAPISEALMRTGMEALDSIPVDPR